MARARGRIRLVRPHPPVDCPACGHAHMNERVETQVFTYGRGDIAVQLSARVPVYTCSDCGFAFTDEAAEEARHEAVCRHLGVMTPTEIQSLRRRHGLSRAELARITRIGTASLNRWENGLLTQSPALDQLLYLCLFEENLRLLRSRDPSEPISLAVEGSGSVLPVSESGQSRPRDPRFRDLEVTPSLREQQQCFRLRLTGT